MKNTKKNKKLKITLISVSLALIGGVVIGTYAHFDPEFNGIENDKIENVSKVDNRSEEVLENINKQVKELNANFSKEETTINTTTQTTLNNTTTAIVKDETREKQIKEIKEIQTNFAKQFVDKLISLRDYSNGEVYKGYSIFIDKYSPLVKNINETLIDTKLSVNSPWLATSNKNSSTTLYSDLKTFVEKTNHHLVALDILDELDVIREKLSSAGYTEDLSTTQTVENQGTEIEGYLLKGVTRIYLETFTRRFVLETKNPELLNKIDSVWTNGLSLIRNDKNLTETERKTNKTELVTEIKTLLSEARTYFKDLTHYDSSKKVNLEFEKFLEKVIGENLHIVLKKLETYLV